MQKEAIVSILKSIRLPFEQMIKTLNCSVTTAHYCFFPPESYLIDIEISEYGPRVLTLYLIDGIVLIHILEGGQVHVPVNTHLLGGLERVVHVLVVVPLDPDLPVWGISARPGCHQGDKDGQES